MVYPTHFMDDWVQLCKLNSKPRLTQSQSFNLFCNGGDGSEAADTKHSSVGAPAVCQGLELPHTLSARFIFTG